ncbi:MAG: nitrogen fixation protein NifQ [Nitrospirota bacterium]
MEGSTLLKEICSDRLEEYQDLLKLLLDHKSGPGEDAGRVAEWIAAACLGDNHLWQDMHLPDRKDLSELIARHFRPLFDKNTADMKWKKFFYKQICESEGFYLCKSPSCSVCVDYNKCFGPEE